MPFQCLLSNQVIPKLDHLSVDLRTSRFYFPLAHDFQWLAFNTNIRLTFDSTYEMLVLRPYIEHSPSFALNVSHLSLKRYSEEEPDAIEFIAENFTNLE